MADATESPALSRLRQRTRHSLSFRRLIMQTQAHTRSHEKRSTRATLAFHRWLRHQTQTQGDADGAVVVAVAVAI